MNTTLRGPDYSDRPFLSSNKALDKALERVRTNPIANRTIELLKGSKLIAVHEGVYVDSKRMSPFIFHAVTTSLVGADIEAMLRVQANEVIVLEWGVLVDDNLRSDRVEVLPSDAFQVLLGHSPELLRIR